MIKKNPKNMKHIKKFDELNEEYDPKVHTGLDITRKALSSPTAKKVLHILSLIDDVVHLDFKNIRNTFKNREGYDKTSELMGELSLAISILKKDIHNPDMEQELFSDIEQYEIDVDKILNYLEDESVKKYLEIDTRGKKNIYEKYYSVIEFLKNFKNWKNGNLEL